MALSVKVGNFALDAGTGDQSITGVGFTPKMVFLISTIGSADGPVNHFHIGMAVVEQGLEDIAMTCTSRNAYGDGESASRVTGAATCALEAGGTGFLYEADYQSHDADGFTIDIDDAGAGYRTGYLCLGGEDIQINEVGYGVAPASTGNASVTGLGFKPTGLILFSIHDSGYSWDFSAKYSIGFVDESGNQASIGGSSQRSADPSDTYCVQRTDRCLTVPNLSGGFYSEASFVSFDDDGFTLNWITNSEEGIYVHFLAFRGPQTKVGSITSQTSTGNFDTTSVGFQPVAGIFASFCNAASENVQDGLQISLGIAAASDEQFVAGGTDEDNQATTDADSFSDDAKIYQNYDFNQTLEGDIAFVSWLANGFRLNQTDADPSGNEIIYMVFGSATTRYVDVAESITVAESINMFLLSVSVGDSVGVADSPTVAVQPTATPAISVTDAISLSESIDALIFLTHNVSIDSTDLNAWAQGIKIYTP